MALISAIAGAQAVGLSLNSDAPAFVEGKPTEQQRERPATDPEFSEADIDDIIGQECFVLGAHPNPDSVTYDSLNLGLFYTSRSTGDTLSFPDSLITLFSIAGDTIITLYKERITAGSELGFITGWDVSFRGVKGTQAYIEAGIILLETMSFHGDPANRYWIESKEIEYGYDWTDSVSVEIDYYPLGSDCYVQIFYRGLDHMDTYREVDVVSPVITWEFDTTEVGIEEKNIPDDIATRVFPNPTNTSAKIIIENKVPNVPIQVFDMTGRKVSVFDPPMINGIVTLDNIDKLPSGVYLIAWMELDDRSSVVQRTEMLNIIK